VRSCIRLRFPGRWVDRLVLAPSLFVRPSARGDYVMMGTPNLAAPPRSSCHIRHPYKASSSHSITSSDRRVQCDPLERFCLSSEGSARMQVDRSSAARYPPSSRYLWCQGDSAQMNAQRRKNSKTLACYEPPVANANANHSLR
jgi:membrane-bound inhibitor of C-type lysozyme